MASDKNNYIVLLLNMLEINRRHVWIEFPQMSYTVYVGVNSSNLIGILLLYYPHRSIKCVLGLSC
jgi:hypothetical protein